MGDGSRVSHLERITARLLEGDISDAARLAAVEPAPPAAATGDLARLRQLLHQVESIQLPDGRLRTDAQPTEVFDAIVELVLSLGAVEEAHRLAGEALERWPLDPYLNGAFGLVRRARGDLSDASVRSATAAAEAMWKIRQPGVHPSVVRQCELLLDWDAQMRALNGDLSAIGQFAHIRDSIAQTSVPLPGQPAARPLIDAPRLDDVDEYDEIAVVEHFLSLIHI